VEFLDTVAQARAFRQVAGERIDADSAAGRALSIYPELPRLNRWHRLRCMRECGLWRGQWLLNVVLILRLLLLPAAR